MEKKLLALFIFLISIQENPIYSQNAVRCGTTQYLDRQKSKDTSLESRLQSNETLLQAAASQAQNQRTTGTIITVPVVFHVIYRTTQQNISQARILDQLNVLNADYAKNNADTTN